MPFSRSRSPESITRSATLLRLVGREGPGLAQHRVDERGLAVVDVGDDRDVPQVAAQSTRRSRVEVMRRTAGEFSGMRSGHLYRDVESGGGETRRVYGPVWSTAASSFTASRPLANLVVRSPGGVARR